MSPNAHYYAVNLRINGDEKKRLEKIRDDGVTVIDVFRAGLEVMTIRLSKKNAKKTN